MRALVGVVVAVAAACTSSHDVHEDAGSDGPTLTDAVSVADAAPGACQAVEPGFAIPGSAPTGSSSIRWSCISCRPSVPRPAMIDSTRIEISASGMVTWRGAAGILEQVQGVRELGCWRVPADASGCRSSYYVCPGDRGPRIAAVAVTDPATTGAAVRALWEMYPQ